MPDRRLFVPRLSAPNDDAPHVAIVKVARDYAAMGEDEAVWCRQVASAAEAAEIHGILASHPSKWTLWGRMVGILGFEQFDGLMDELITKTRAVRAAVLDDATGVPLHKTLDPGSSVKAEGLRTGVRRPGRSRKGDRA